MHQYYILKYKSGQIVALISVIWSFGVAQSISVFDIWKTKSPLFSPTQNQLCDRQSPPFLQNRLQPPLWLWPYVGVTVGPLIPPCAAVIKKSGLILPYPSPTYWKPLNWWMRTLWGMAGVVMLVIFLQVYLPLGCLEERMNDNFLGPRRGRKTRGPAVPRLRGVKSERGGLAWLIET